VDEELRQWLKELDRLNAGIKPFADRVFRKLSPRGYWRIPPTVEEEMFERLFYFYHGAILNNGDVSAYVPFMIENKAALEAVGAHGCLATLEKLMPFYEEQQRLPTEVAKEKYWIEIKTDLENAGELQEDSIAFARLLLKYAQKNSQRLGTGLAD
jgi:hypothetical protein